MRSEARRIQREIEEDTSLEERVSRVAPGSRKTGGCQAPYVLRMYGEFIKGERFKTERPRRNPEKGPGYPTGRPSHEVDAKYARSFARVASEDAYRRYEAPLLEVYASNREPSEHSLALAKEFEELLAQSLEKRPFVLRLGVDQAKDASDALIPVRTCAAALGVSVKTIHRWIEGGLAGQVAHGYRAVQKQGSYYFVNYHAARVWKETRGRKLKKDPKAVPASETSVYNNSRQKV